VQRWALRLVYCLLPDPVRVNKNETPGVKV
jgi:hypothetical protein